jgi:hypothetical protein
MRPSTKRGIRIWFLLLLLLGGPAWAQSYIPNHDRTPGSINPYITQNNIAQTVCLPGYTKIVRPPSPYTSQLKAKQIRELGLPGTPLDYREDHLVPLCVGGHPSDPRNLWPEPVSGRWSASVKDQLEASVCRQVCRGDITLEQGQAIFLRPDWTREYLQFFAR